MNRFALFTCFILACTILGLPHFASAQSPVIIRENVETHDLGYTNEVWDSTTLTQLSVGNAGANQIWDLNHVPDDYLYETFSFEDPANTPHGDLFPSADHSVETVGEDAYDYYFLNDFVYSLMGAYSANGTEIRYSDSKDIFRFPMAFNSAFTDSYAASWTENGVTVNRTGSIDHLVDGDGEVFLPFGPQEEAIRVKTVDQWTDQSVNGTVSMRREYYTWYRAGSAIPMATIGYETNGVDTARFGSFLGALIVCICPPPFGDGFSLYPNPATDRSSISIYLAQDRPISLRIINTAGQVLLEEDWGMQLQGQIDHELDLNTLAHGLYFVELKIGEEVFLEKLDYIR